MLNNKLNNYYINVWAFYCTVFIDLYFFKNNKYLNESSKWKEPTSSYYDFIFEHEKNSLQQLTEYKQVNHLTNIKQQGKQSIY